MRFLPLFFDLTAGPVLLVGAGAQALAKLRILQAAGAKVRWYVLSPEETLNADASLVERHVGLPSDEDFIGAIALVASVDKSTDEALAKRARAMNLPVNIVDRPELSTFIFPAIVDRGDVVVAVGTSGTSPVLARRLRERIEELLPERIGDFASFMGRYRERLNTLRHRGFSTRAILGKGHRRPDRCAVSRRPRGQGGSGPPHRNRARGSRYCAPRAGADRGRGSG